MQKTVRVREILACKKKKSNDGYLMLILFGGCKRNETNTPQ